MRFDLQASREEIKSHYKPCPTCSEEIKALLITNASNPFDTLVEKVWNGDIKPEDIDADMLDFTASRLTGAINKGYGATTLSSEAFFYNDIVMKRNAYEFAAAKTYQQLKEIRNLKNTGVYKTFEEFSKAAKDSGLDNLYNNLWMDVESSTALAGSQMSTKWLEMEENLDVTPNLRYDTAGDERVRGEHAAMDGIIKAYDDSFWNTYYPPNGYGCRCDATPTDAKPNKKTINKKTTSVDEKFKNNVGKTGKVFSKKSSYFKHIQDDKVSYHSAVQNALKENKSKLMYKKGKGELSIHPLQMEHELKANIKTGKFLADNNIKVELLEYLEEEGVTNVDAKLNGDLAEFKNPDNPTKGAIQRSIKEASRQGAEKAVIYLENFDYNEVKRGLQACFGPDGEWNKEIKDVWMIYDNKLVTLSREEIIGREFYEKL